MILMSTKRARKRKFRNTLSRAFDETDKEMPNFIGDFHMGLSGCALSRNDELRLKPYQGTTFRGKQYYSYKVKQYQEKCRIKYAVHLSDEDRDKLLTKRILDRHTIQDYIEKLHRNLITDPIGQAALEQQCITERWVAVSLFWINHAPVAKVKSGDHSFLIVLSYDAPE